MGFVNPSSSNQKMCFRQTEGDLGNPRRWIFCISSWSTPPGATWGVGYRLAVAGPVAGGWLDW